MRQNQASTLKETLIINIENFFKTKKILLLIILCGFVGVILFFIIWNTNTKQIVETSTKLVEDIEKKYSNWITEENETKKSTIEEEILNELSNVLKKYPGSYANQRALFIRAQYYINKKEWEKAAKDYIDLTKEFPKSTLAEECLLNAASCYEEMTNYNEAISLHKEFQNKFSNSYKIPYSYFSIGRIFEQTNNYSEAGKIYEKMESDYLTSGWTKLAQNRLIYLKANNLYKNE